MVNYGGRITDDKDMRTSDIIIAGFYNPDILSEDFTFSRSGRCEDVKQLLLWYGVRSTVPGTAELLCAREFCARSSCNHPSRPCLCGFFEKTGTKQAPSAIPFLAESRPHDTLSARIVCPLP